MIELKIPTSAAVILLQERMEYELQMRKAANLFEDEIMLEDLNGKDLMEIIETAAFDLVFLLPAEIFSEDNNIAQIISKAFEQLGKIYHNEEIAKYTVERAKILTKPIYSIIDKSHEEKLYLKN